MCIVGQLAVLRLFSFQLSGGLASAASYLFKRSPKVLLGSAPPPLLLPAGHGPARRLTPPPALRGELTRRLRRNRPAPLLFAVLLGHGRLLTALRGQRAALGASDLLLLPNAISEAAEGGEGGGEGRGGEGGGGEGRGDSRETARPSNPQTPPAPPASA